MDESARLVVGKPNIMDREGFLRDVEEILETRIFTNLGPFTVKLENLVRSKLQVKHAIAVSNASVGLAMALRAAELTTGGEVILPSYTFIATAHAVIECGLKPVFCDCDSTTHLLRPDEIIKHITEDTVAIMAVNLWGLGCDVEGIEEIARRHRLSVIYDSAHSFGTRIHNGTPIGNFGDAEVFSLHATKLFNSFEGGIITTNNDAMAERLLPMRNFGITGQDEVSSWGSNYKLSEIHAAFAVRQLFHIDETIQIYRRNAELYSKLLEEHKIEGISCWNARFLNHQGCTHAYVCFEVDGNCSLSRDALVAMLRERNIYAKRYFFPGIHKCQPYVRLKTSTKLPSTEQLCREVLILPTGTSVLPADIEFIVSLIAKLTKECGVESKQLKVVEDISMDFSHLDERRRYLTELRQKYRTLMLACEDDLHDLEARMSSTKTELASNNS